MAGTLLFNPVSSAIAATHAPGPASRDQELVVAKELRFEWVLVLAMLAGATLPLGGNHSVVWLLMSVASALAILILAVRNRLPKLSAPAAWLPLLALPMVIVFHGLAQSVLGWYGDTATGSIAPRDTFVGALRVTGLGLFFLLALRAADDRRCRDRMLGGIFVLGTIVAGWAIATPEMVEQEVPVGIVGPFANRNNFATFLGMALMVGLARSLDQAEIPYRTLQQRLARFAALTGNLILISALVATQSRMGLVATIVGAGVVLALQSKRLTQAATIVAGLFLAALIISGKGMISRFTFLPADWTLRADFYKQILSLIGQRPFSGHGLDSFALAFESVHAPPVSAAFLWDRAHSTYLELWVENGVILGSLPIVAGLWTCVLLIRRAKGRSGERQFAAAAALGALVLGATHAVFDFGLEILANQLLLIAILASGLARPISAGRSDLNAKVQR